MVSTFLVQSRFNTRAEQGRSCHFTLVGQAGQHLRHLLSYPVQNTATDGRRWPVPPFVPKDSGFDCAAEKRSGTCTLRSSPDPNSCLVVSVILPVCGGHGQRERGKGSCNGYQGIAPSPTSRTFCVSTIRTYGQDEYRNWPNPRRRDIHPPLLAAPFLERPEEQARLAQQRMRGRILPIPTCEVGVIFHLVAFPPLFPLPSVHVLLFPLSSTRP